MESRVRYRLNEYLHVLEHGTEKAVGVSTPRVQPHPTLGVHDADVTDIGRMLDQVWAADDRHWPRRLERPFLARLSRHAQRQFSHLVKNGCQPDQLALRFHKAASVGSASRDQEKLLRELDQIETLAETSESAVSRLLSRQTQLDEFFIKTGYRSVEGEPGGATLKLIALDLQDWCAEQRADIARLRKQLDRRRQPFLGDAQVKLSRSVNAATGRYHDREVTSILGELLADVGKPERGTEWLKRKRSRWTASRGGQTDDY